MKASCELLPNRSWNLLEAMLRRRGYGVQTRQRRRCRCVGKRHYGLEALPQGAAAGDRLSAGTLRHPASVEGTRPLRCPRRVLYRGSAQRFDHELSDRRGGYRWDRTVRNRRSDDPIRAGADGPAPAFPRSSAKAIDSSPNSPFGTPRIAAWTSSSAAGWRGAAWDPGAASNSSLPRRGQDGGMGDRGSRRRPDVALRGRRPTSRPAPRPGAR